MRVGNNPLKGGYAEMLPKVVGIVITHLPNFTGYHKDRFKVVQTCLNSMRDNAQMNISMCVYDNGSCPEFREWLQDEYRPDFLIFSENYGKSSARAAAVRMFQPGTILCVSDDDMYYYPGWLRPQLQLLKAFPHVGAVSGYPVRTQHRWGNENTLKWAAADPECQIDYGRFIPDEWEYDFAISIGRSPADHVVMTAKDTDIRLSYRGKQAYATAHHCQFIAYAEKIADLVEWEWEAVPDEKIFDRAIDAAGLLRLTTTDRLVRHIGNILDQDLLRDKNYAEG